MLYVLLGRPVKLGSNALPAHHQHPLRLSRQHAPVQDTYLSPGQASRLHILSSAVSLPDAESDDEPEMPLHASTHAAGLEAAATPQEDKAHSIAEGVQSTASESSHATADDSASSISGMSGVSSIAATEVVDDQQDTAGRFLGASCAQQDWLR